MDAGLESLGPCHTKEEQGRDFHLLSDTCQNAASQIKESGKRMDQHRVRLVLFKLSMEWILDKELSCYQ